MKILLPGGSGQIGTILARHLHTQAHDVLVLSRTPPPLEAGLSRRRIARPPQTCPPLFYAHEPRSRRRLLRPLRSGPRRPRRNPRPRHPVLLLDSRPRLLPCNLPPPRPPRDHRRNQ